MPEQSAATTSGPEGSIAVVGLHGGQWFGTRAHSALRSADAIVGAKRLHAALDDSLSTPLTGERVELFGPLGEVLDLIELRRDLGQRVCMLASGDPGFFGIERLLAGRFGAAVEVHPAPSSVALAFARARMPWDDAAVVSCHGRSLERALPHILAATKVAVLVSASTPPEQIGRALLDAGSDHRHATVCSRLGEADERVTTTDLVGLAAGTFDPLSVLILTTEDRPVAPGAVVSWGRPIASFRHRGAMITKPEVRAVVLSKLELFGAATMWDLGAASGSVGIEAARLAPGLRVFAVEQNAEDCDRIRANITRVPVSVVEGRAPEALASLPDPDRVFVGGGGIVAFDAACERLRSGGVIVGAFAVLATALSVAERLGPTAELVQLQVNRGTPIGPDHQLRLDAENPVFIVWGSPDQSRTSQPPEARPSEARPSEER